MGDEAAVSFLSGVPLFAELSPADLRELSWVVSPFRAAAGERLFRQGDPGDALYCVEHGRVAVSVRTPGGADVVLSEAGAGQVLGEMALLDAGPRSATATALEATTGYALSAPGFEVLCATLRRAGFKVLRHLATLLATRLRTEARQSEGGDTVPVDEALDRGAAGWANGSPVPPPGAPALDRGYLAGLPLFRRLSAEELEDLLGRAAVRAVPRRHVLFREGDPASSCFVVLRGAVLVCVHRRGAYRKVAVEGPGSLVGHFALLAPGPRSATCLTREDSVLLEIDRATFDGMFGADSAAAFKLLAAAAEVLSGELRRTNSRRGLTAPPP